MFQLRLGTGVPTSVAGSSLKSTAAVQTPTDGTFQHIQLSYVTLTFVGNFFVPPTFSISSFVEYAVITAARVLTIMSATW